MEEIDLDTISLLSTIKTPKKLMTLLQQQITKTPGELNGQRDNENCYQTERKPF